MAHIHETRRDGRDAQKLNFFFSRREELVKDSFLHGFRDRGYRDLIDISRIPNLNFAGE